MPKGKCGVIYILVCILAIGLVACGSKKETGGQSLEISIPLYEKLEYATGEAVRGDLQPELQLSLREDSFHSINYQVDQDDLKVKKLYVSLGDWVEKGDMLVDFASDEVDKSIKESRDAFEENTLMIAHYKRLNKIEKNQQNLDNIKDLQEQNRILKVRMQELQSQLSEYQIKATESGKIIGIDETLEYGYATTGQTLISESCGSGKYRATTSDTYPFAIGQIFTAKLGVAEYKMKLEKIEDSEDGQKKLLFCSVSSLKGVSATDTLYITQKKEPLQDVVYVPEKAVFKAGNSHYVYTMDENGFRTGVKVNVGDTVQNGQDAVVVIVSGLKGGEQVMVR